MYVVSVSKIHLSYPHRFPKSQNQRIVLSWKGPLEVLSFDSSEQGMEEQCGGAEPPTSVKPPHQEMFLASAGNESFSAKS